MGIDGHRSYNWIHGIHYGVTDRPRLSEPSLEPCIADKLREGLVEVFVVGSMAFRCSQARHGASGRLDVSCHLAAKSGTNKSTCLVHGSTQRKCLIGIWRHQFWACVIQILPNGFCSVHIADRMHSNSRSQWGALYWGFIVSRWWKSALYATRNWIDSATVLYSSQRIWVLCSCTRIIVHSAKRAFVLAFGGTGSVLCYQHKGITNNAVVCSIYAVIWTRKRILMPIHGAELVVQFCFQALWV